MKTIILMGMVMSLTILIFSYLLEKRKYMSCSINDFTKYCEYFIDGIDKIMFIPNTSVLGLTYNEAGVISKLSVDGEFIELEGNQDTTFSIDSNDFEFTYSLSTTAIDFYYANYDATAKYFVCVHTKQGDWFCFGYKYGASFKATNNGSLWTFKFDLTTEEKPFGAIDSAFDDYSIRPWDLTILDGNTYFTCELDLNLKRTGWKHITVLGLIDKESRQPLDKYMHLTSYSKRKQAVMVMVGAAVPTQYDLLSRYEATATTVNGFPVLEYDPVNCTVQYASDLSTSTIYFDFTTNSEDGAFTITSTMPWIISDRMYSTNIPEGIHISQTSGDMGEDIPLFLTVDDTFYGTANIVLWQQPIEHSPSGPKSLTMTVVRGKIETSATDLIFGSDGNVTQTVHIKTPENSGFTYTVSDSWISVYTSATDSNYCGIVANSSTTEERSGYVTFSNKVIPSAKVVVYVHQYLGTRYYPTDVETHWGIHTTNKNNTDIAVQLFGVNDDVDGRICGFNNEQSIGNFAYYSGSEIVVNWAQMKKSGSTPTVIVYANKKKPSSLVERVAARRVRITAATDGYYPNLYATYKNEVWEGNTDEGIWLGEWADPEEENERFAPVGPALFYDNEWQIARYNSLLKADYLVIGGVRYNVTYAVQIGKERYYNTSGQRYITIYSTKCPVVNGYIMYNGFLHKVEMYVTIESTRYILRFMTTDENGNAVKVENDSTTIYFRRELAQGGSHIPDYLSPYSISTLYPYKTVGEKNFDNVPKLTTPVLWATCQNMDASTINYVIRKQPLPSGPTT